MAPSKWDEEEEESVSPPPVAARRRFDDEEEDDVLDSWDAAEDSEVEREKAAKAAETKAKAEAEAAAKKKSKGQRIAEHQETRRKAAEEADDSDEESEDESDKRARLRRTEKDSDLKHAEDLFGDIDLNRNRGKNKSVVVNDGSGDPSQAIDLSAMALFKPTTKDQFEKLTSTIAPLISAHSKKPQYALWLPEFAKQLAKGLPSGDIKKVASALTTLSNEKMKEERAADKGNKKTKAAKTKVSLVASRDNRIETTSYDDDGLGDDDFM
ncbi:eukaryotic translation initiation factor 3 subunit J [Aspergillus pseudoustus]|uniref:Eukaryotic translation initiation factor 3 subunit J n=1 Tax=Aspergillus pseudoustus TaxID=1810923 RepID=A0ABR4KZQ4_9EURO